MPYLTSSSGLCFPNTLTEDAKKGRHTRRFSPNNSVQRTCSHVRIATLPAGMRSIEACRKAPECGRLSA